MLVKKNFEFIYIYNLRWILINRLNLLANTHQIPKIKKGLLFFMLRKLEDFNNIKISNYFYLLKFFFGCKAFLLKYKAFFNLGTWYYNFKVTIILTKKHLYLNLFFLMNDFLPFIRHDYIKTQTNCTKMNKSVISFEITDLTLLNDKKTNLGLFNLKESLNLFLFITGCQTINISKIVLKNFKFLI